MSSILSGVPLGLGTQGVADALVGMAKLGEAHLFTEEMDRILQACTTDAAVMACMHKADSLALLIGAGGRVSTLMSDERRPSISRPRWEGSASPGRSWWT